MPFTRSSLQTIVDRIISDFQTRITGATSLLRRSTLSIIAKINAGAFHLLYEYLDYQARQLFITTADEAGLEAHAAEYGITRNAAEYATGSGVATGTNGSIIPAGTELQSTDEQVYSIDTAVTIAAGVGTVDFTANVAGEDGNEDGGATLSFVNPILGVNASVTVDSDGIAGGTDEEIDSDFRERILRRKRKPPHGGAVFDYETWALEVSGTTRAWAFSQYNGTGTVGLAFVRDNDDSLIPNSTLREEMEDYIIEHTDPASGETVGIPVTAEPGFYVIEIEELAVDFDISIYPNTTAVQDAIQEQLEELILNDGGPEQTLYLSSISEAISLAEGEQRHTLNSPSADVTATSGQVHTLGVITWSDY